jgi:hypothetical protein
MAGRNQEAAWMRQWRAGGRPAWRHMFVRVTASRVACKACGRRGLGNFDYPSPWQVGCLIGHAYECERCGAPTHNLTQHQSCKLHHACCGEHKNTQYQQLLEALS